MRDILRRLINTICAGGSRIPLPHNRKFVTDFLHYAKHVPSQPLTRSCNISSLVNLRNQSPTNISWLAIMIRAYILMSEKYPTVKRCFLKWPWEQLYEHPHHICRFVVSREFNGENQLFFANIKQPEQMQLTELHDYIQELKILPVEQIPNFRRQILLPRVPTPVRRLLWWTALNLSGAVKVRFTGTFGVTTVGGKNAVSIHPPSIGNIVMTYGPISPQGDVRVTFVYDHRVFDGGMIADCLAEFEAQLQGQVAKELALLQPHQNYRRSA